MTNKTQDLIQYLNSLLNDSSVLPFIPEALKDIEGVTDIDQTLRNFRQSIKIIGNGDLSEPLNGKGYLMGTLKSLQATLRNLIWQTKSIASGNFSNRIEFLGEFSESFNSMVKKLDQTINEVNEAKALFELFFDTIPDATMIISYNEFIIFNCNNAFEKFVGFSKDELIDKGLKDISFFKDDNQEKKFEEAIRGLDKPQNISIDLITKDGILSHGLFSSALITVDNKKYVLCVIKNITELKKMEIKLRTSEEVHRLLADNASDVIWTMDLTGKFTYISPSVEKLRGFTAEEVMAQSPEELLCLSSRRHLEKGLEDAIYHVQNNLPFKIFRGDVEQPCKDGSTVWTDLTVSGIYDKENHFLGMLGVTRDITDRVAMENEIRRLTEIDRLTQLYNRMKLDTVLKFEIERSNRSKSVFSIILFDIDNFKMVNDTFGHIVGDDVLKDFSEIIKKTIRKIDTAGRWGGEEFMVILPESDALGAFTLAEKLRVRISEHHFQRVGHLTASFGIAEFDGIKDETELVSKADAAMYEAKKTGKNRVCKLVYGGHYEKESID